MIKKFNEFMNESHSNVSNNKKGYKPKNKKEPKSSLLRISSRWTITQICTL